MHYKTGPDVKFTASRSLTSSSRIPSTSASSFHTVAVLHAARRQGQSAKKRNIQRTQERLTKEAENQPSVVLGTRSREEEALWARCDLAKCLVNPHNLNGPPATSSSSSSTTPSILAETLEVSDLGTTVTVPKNTNYGVGPVEKQMLFQELPVLSASAPFLVADSNFKSVFEAKGSGLAPEELARRQEVALKTEKSKMDAFAKVIDLQNANAQGIACENRRRIILEFSSPVNPFDPGRAEVQAALLTYKIRNLWSHLTTFKRDVGNRRGILKLIHQRAKILRYLKKKDQNRYEAVLPRLALDSESVEGELVI
ncbi:30S ribosomal protein S15 [Leucoagaricus sp. SymC.cos]|nr:30S ribosomal protein S15 [Leucoagaricus sp. SymC.cos]